MAHVSYKLNNAIEGALAGGGDPATSPLYVFGPFLKLIVVAGVANITFGASVWLVVLTVALVSAMYRLVMIWVTDGSGGSGLSEEEFGGWAVKVNASITFIEYTLTFLVSMAALVTFLADRFPILNEPFLGFQLRTWVAIGLSLLTGWLVNRGPRMAARAFGPATAGVLLLLWAMIIAAILQLGLKLPRLNLEAFSPQYLRLTLGGYARILAVMTGIEIFANLVAAYEGTPRRRSRTAFYSLLIIMGTTSMAMLVVGPAIFQLSDPTNLEVSVFTQTMDQLLPEPLAYLGTLVGVAVLLSASAASAQGLQNLALGLNLRNYVPAVVSQRNRFGVAAMPVWIEVAIVSSCFLAFGTSEETYLAIYAAGVFILLSMTGWAAARRLRRDTAANHSWRNWASLLGTVSAAALTTVATVIIFGERFREGAWIYFILLPLLYLGFGFFRRRLGEPTPLENRLGMLTVQRKYLPFGRAGPSGEDQVEVSNVMLTLDESSFAEQALPTALALCKAYQASLSLISVTGPNTHRRAILPWSRLPLNNRQTLQEQTARDNYLKKVADRAAEAGVRARRLVYPGQQAAEEIAAKARDERIDLLVMSTRGRSGAARTLLGSVANRVVQLVHIPVLLFRSERALPGPEANFRRLLVALDGSDSAELSLRYAESLARVFQAEILLLAVPDGLEKAEEQKELRDYVDGLARGLDESGLEARGIVSGSQPAQTILEVAESEAADLIMLATHGLGGLDRLMIGSVADRVVQASARPVFLIPVRPQM
jgi:nucleotide-binding universal stress UspA family protein